MKSMVYRQKSNLIFFDINKEVNDEKKFPHKIQNAVLCHTAQEFKNYRRVSGYNLVCRFRDPENYHEIVEHLNQDDNFTLVVDELASHDVTANSLPKEWKRLITTHRHGNKILMLATQSPVLIHSVVLANFNHLFIFRSINHNLKNLSAKISLEPEHMRRIPGLGVGEYVYLKG